MVNKVCISGYYGFDNFGDEAILKVLIENLHKFEVTVFSVNPKITSEYYNVKSVHTFKIFDIIRTIYNNDCLISGGGSLLQDSTSLKSLLYYLFVIIIALIFHKKVIIFAQGIGPINNKALRLLTMHILKQTNFITVRDNNSFQLLNKYGIKSEKCIDPVWNIKIDKCEIKDRIGIQLRRYSFVNDDFLYKLASNVNKYFFDKKICILSLQNKLDIEVCENFQKILIKINPDIDVCVIPNNSCDKVIKDIASLNILIAMRYHACLIGIKTGAKVLPINYDIKVQTLAKDFGLPYINSIKDIDTTFETFINNEIEYDKQKINSLKFDFDRILRYLLN